MRPSAALAALLTVPVFLVAGSVAPAAAPAPPRVAPAPSSPPSQAPPPQFLGVDDLRPGMRGVARTVFEGSALEEFEVEIIGVLKNAIGPQQDLILSRLHGDKVEFTGVVAGMSGSPVYVDGKLIGALSYRIGNFTKEAIAGITPIADMIKVADAGGGPRAAGEAPPAGGARRAGGAERAAATPGQEVSIAPDLLGRFLAGGEAPRPAASGLQPIGVPLVCSGCDPGVLRYYAPIFEAVGLQPVAGGGQVQPGGALPLVPGSPIGAAMVTGDLSVVGIGTLTHVEGNRVFAFGHPLLGTGGVELPMVQAQVLLTLASDAGSFKIANATPPVGTIFRDGLTAIVGTIGRVAATIPVTVVLKEPGGTRRFQYSVLRDRSWAPVLLAATTANSLVRIVDYESGATLALRSRILLDGQPEVVYEDLYSGTNRSQPIHLSVANDVGGLLGLLINNRFEEARVRSAEVEIAVLKEAQVGTLSSLRAARTDVRPGEPFTVTAVVRPYRGDEREVTWQVAFPEDTLPGDADITVGSGPAIDGLDRRILDRQLAQASGLGDLVRLANHQRRSDALYLRLGRRAPAAVVRSEILPDLPLSIFAVLNNPRLSAETTLMADAPILEIEKDLGLVVIGGRRISVRVK